MGMYTEIYVNVDLKTNTPSDVITTLQMVCNRDWTSLETEGRPSRWGVLFNNGSYYTPSTSVAELTYDHIGKNYSLLGKGDIKNYENEIEQFFEFISPWVDVDGFIGYMRYEEHTEPTLVYLNDGVISYVRGEVK